MDDKKPAVRLLFRTYGQKLTVFVIDCDRLKPNTDIRQSAINLLHEILDEQGVQGTHKTEQILSLPTDILARYGIRLEPAGIDAIVNLGGSPILPYTAR